MPKATPDYNQHVNALNQRLMQLHALSHALYELTLNLPKGEELPPLASLSLRLCEEAEQHVAELDCYCRALSHNTNREG